jgi:hypothetical protein
MNFFPRQSSIRGTTQTQNRAQSRRTFSLPHVPPAITLRVLRDRDNTITFMFEKLEVYQRAIVAFVPLRS